MRKNNYTYEREFNFKEANYRWHNTINNLGFKFNLTNLGKFGTYTYRCELFAPLTKDKFVGYGKGTKSQSILSARYEALEHATSVPNSKYNSLYYFSISESIEFNHPILRSKTPAQLLADPNLIDKRLPWIKFNNVSQKESYYYVLAAACTPSYLQYRDENDIFDYNTIYLQHTDNGYASGCTYNEALLHALLELIERDALSFFLIKTFLCAQENYIREADLDEFNIPQKTQAFINNFLSRSGSTLNIFEMPNELGLPAYCAILNNTTLLLPISGFGCSPIKLRALMRAIYETVELYNSYTVNKLIMDEYTIDFFKDWPILLTCASLNFTHIKKSQYRKESYFSSYKDPQYKNTEECLQYIISELTKNNFDIYVNIQARTATFCTLQAIIPTFEELHSLLGGTIPIIGIRARSLFNTDINDNTDE